MPTSARPPWVLLAPKGGELLRPLLDATEGFGGTWVTLDGSQISTEPGLFRTMHSRLSFPPYFGYNWDALEECLGDVRYWIDSDAVLFTLRMPTKLSRWTIFHCSLRSCAAQVSGQE